MNNYEFFTPELLDEIREQFHYVTESPYAGERIFLDSVSGSLRLKSMVDAVSEEVASYAQAHRIDPASDHLEEVINNFRDDVRLLVGASEGHIMTAMSGTHSLYRVVNAILVNAEKNANIVTSNLEHPAVYESTHFFAEQYGVERRVVKFDKDAGYVRKADVLDKVDSDTRLLILIHGSNVTGAVNNIKEITKEARKINPDIFVVFDGVQYSPHGLIEFDEYGIDGYVLSGYKLFCKKNSGIIITNDRLANQPHWKFREKPITDWSLGAEDEATYAGFSAVVRYLEWLGSKFTDSKNKREQIKVAMNKVHEHTIALLDLVLHGNDQVRGLKDMEHVSIHGMEEDISKRTGLVAMRINDEDSNEISNKYFTDGGISVSPRLRNIYARHVLEHLEVENLVRVSMCHYIKPEEIIEFLKFTETLK